MKKEKLLQKLLSGSKNIRFSDLQGIVGQFGFKLVRISGSHHIYSHSQIIELFNLQNVNGKAKPYQIKQFLALVERYHLTWEKK